MAESNEKAVDIRCWRNKQSGLRVVKNTTGNVSDAKGGALQRVGFSKKAVSPGKRSTKHHEALIGHRAIQLLRTHEDEKEMSKNMRNT